MLYTAIIVEPRQHPAMKFVLNNFLDTLDDRWSFIIFHGIDNKEWLEKIIDNNFNLSKNRITLVNLNVTNIEPLDGYSKYMTSIDFINQIPTETFLIFQTDTMISSLHKNLIYDFINYDYVGAPWFKTEDSKNPFDGKIGNGGLSLRKKSKMLEVIHNVPYPENMAEDEYFCIHNKTIPLNKPTYEQAKLFAIETTYSPLSFGLHKAWIYITNYDLEKQFPGYNELVRLNQI
jgi:hypothetical protein